MQRFFFDRLTQPQQPTPLDAESRLALLRESIREEIQRLLSGRTFLNGYAPFAPANQGTKSILNWGIDSPVDFGSSYAELTRLAQQILDAIHTFEPRLHNPKASIVGRIKNSKQAHILISGSIESEGITDAFEYRFPVGGHQS
ncbi:GPW/gp25 family protein [Alteromonas sp. a30]|uniref:GPW/gp25 family protein n=1 Tax=Alteromonas sp. a30 TaxID=2730917 RepID=UPI00227E278F|nr:GPW/gp25 family protein [Alteromonas sp. a30]MCY7293839.1 hypothetical protein [Alteromonas sp. a30]